MFKETLIIFALTASVTAPSFAEDTSPSPAEIFGQRMLTDSDTRNRNRVGPTLAHQRMANKADVSTSDYTHQEIAHILTARGSANKSVIEVAMNKVNGLRPMPVAHASAGEIALAKTLGVSADEYSLADLVKMKMAQDF